jgi:hypothetical protein
MKKTLMLATAVAMFAAPALAQTPGLGTQYSDHISTFQVNAPVANFCKFGSVGNEGRGGLNVTSNGNNSYGNGADMGDQAFVVDIQKDDDNTIQAANGSFSYAQAQCNTLYSVTTTSTNGGLAAEYQGPAAAAFAKTVNYEIAFETTISKAATAYQQVASTNTLISSGTPFAGAATFRFNIPASPKLLLAGTYRDELRLTMSPLTGGASI